MKHFYWLVFLGFAWHATAQRNVLLIIADDLSPDYFGFYEDHGDTVDVPNLRKLMNRGIRFDNLMANPVCSATRATILTGRYGFRTGVGGIVGGQGGSNELDPAELTLPSLLKSYRPDIATANIGKWHLHQAMPVSQLKYPNQLGYDWFEGPFIGALQSFTNWTKYTNGVPGTVTTYATTENVNNAVSWLKNVNKEDPFFLWLAFNAPHEPLHLPPSHLHSFNTLSGTQMDINAKPKSYFKAMVQALDTEIGRLLDSLQALNRLEETDIIFIGDNGNTFKTAQNGDNKKAKGTIYQYGVHVPLIIAGPSVANPGRTSDALINTADLFATVLELMGDYSWSNEIPVSNPVDTKSMVPLIKNQATAIRPWSFCENFKLIPDENDGKAMRNQDYKLINFDDGHQEFYHLTADPAENNDLLQRTLSAGEREQYNYLCTEMSGLVGGVYCKSTIAVKEVEEDDFTFTVSPNPFDYGTTVRFDREMDHVTLSLSNMLGTKIKETMFSGKEWQLQREGCAPGVYVLQVVLPNGRRASTKIMVN
ncbi:MAG: sulfatase-like hydrolase/transferase [Saprospiraceae bacterium]|nr:sulfatase-like hydrolase/transferase [Saprospiraceae bacterium]